MVLIKTAKIKKQYREAHGLNLTEDQWADDGDFDECCFCVSWTGGHIHAATHFPRLLEINGTLNVCLVA